MMEATEWKSFDAQMDLLHESEILETRDLCSHVQVDDGRLHERLLDGNGERQEGVEHVGCHLLDARVRVRTFRA